MVDSLSIAAIGGEEVYFCCVQSILPELAQPEWLRGCLLSRGLLGKRP